MAFTQKTLVISYFLFISVIIINPYSSVYGYNYDIPELPYTNESLESRIIFTGFDHTLMDQILMPYGLLEGIMNYYNSYPQAYVEKIFSINHYFELASTDFDETLFTYLNTSSRPDTLTDNDETSNRYRSIYPREFNFTGRFISTNSVIDWITQNYDTYFGTPPIPGYTLIIANMSILDDHNYPYHWYNETYIDLDSNANIRKNYMIGYGSQERVYYLDLSSDSYYLQDAGENTTIQEMNLLYDFSTSYGQRRLAEYFAEWIYEIERNLWVQDFINYPSTPIGDYQTGINHYFEILVICNITDFTINDLTWTINSSYILQEIKELLPWIKIDIEVRFVYLEDNPRLNSIIQQSLVPWGEFKTLVNSKYAVDLTPLYEELYLNTYSYMDKKFTSSFYTVHHLTYAFLFDDALFGIPEKGQLEPNLLGISLQDKINRPLSIISQDFNYLLGENRSNPQPTHGLTRTIIHELGHQLSLMHPFQFGEVGNFIDDVMAYYSYSSEFSIFSKDNLQRAQIDMLLKKSRTIILEGAKNSYLKVYDQDLVDFFDKKNNSYFEIKEKYNTMNYVEAYSLAMSLYKSLFDFNPELDGIQDMREFTEIIPVFFFAMLFFLIIAVYYRTKVQVLKTLGQKPQYLSKDVVNNIEKKSKERFIASRKAAGKKVDTTMENNSPTNNQNDD